MKRLVQLITLLLMVFLSGCGENETTFQNNNVPTVQIVKPIDNESFNVNEVIEFKGNSSDQDGSVVAHFWDFGDGTISTVQNPSHSYADGDLYSVQYRVIDNNGAKISSYINVNINGVEIEHKDTDIDGIQDLFDKCPDTQGDFEIVYSNGCSESQVFITTWDTSKTNYSSTSLNQIKLPLDKDGTYDFTIEWGDGCIDQITRHNQPEILHTYINNDIYNIKIYGVIDGFGFTENENIITSDNCKIIDVKRWGRVKLHNKGGQFYRAWNLKGFSASDNLDLSHITNMSHMFYASNSFNQPIGDWNVSKVTVMDSMFEYAISFDQAIDDWDVSSVTTMESMFESAYSFNQDVCNWDVSSVTTMENMFESAYSFNQDMNCWKEKIDNVDNIYEMFEYSGMDQLPDWYPY